MFLFPAITSFKNNTKKEEKKDHWKCRFILLNVWKVFYSKNDYTKRFLLFINSNFKDKMMHNLKILLSTLFIIKIFLNQF